jgi:hypothetical protein
LGRRGKCPAQFDDGAETKIKPRQPGEMTWNEYKAQMERDEAVKAKMTKHGWFSQEAIAARKEQCAVLRALKAAAKKMVKP